jgi:hypothetical protein
MPGPQKIWVPQPASKLYGAQGADPESIRDQLVDMYGENTVQRAELSILLDLMMLNGVIKPTEFIEVMQKKLYKLDQKRRVAAMGDNG